MPTWVWGSGSGRFQPYEESVQHALEAAFQRGDDSARVLLNGGRPYVVSSLQGEHKRQRPEGDATKSRRVLRRVSSAGVDS